MMNIREKTTDELLQMKDEDIDFSDIPELKEAFFDEALLVFPLEDREVIDWFRRKFGASYRNRMLGVLREYMKNQANNVR